MKSSILRSLMIALGILLSIYVKADYSSVTINGICYNLATASKKATVTHKTYTGAVTIPSSVVYNGVTYNVTSIGQTAFSACSGLTSVSIPNSVTSIDYQAFYSCTNLTSIVIPKSVTSIGVGIFYNCSGLTSIQIESGNTVYDSRNNCNAIIEKASKTLIAGCKKSTIPDGITTIGEAALAFCGFTSISIPSSVTSIGNEAFYGCNILTSLTIPNSVTSIGEWAFYNCRALTSLTIPSSVTSIGYAAFNNCKGLATINSEIVTPFVFGEYAFSGISSTCKLTVPKGKKEAYIAAGWTESVFKGGIVEIVPNISFADANVKAICVANWDTNGDGELNQEEAAAVTSLGSVFKGNTTITKFEELSYFTGLTSISANEFRGCSSLGSIIIPNSVISIGNDAFRACSSLTSISIPNGVTSISSQTFYLCNELTSIKLPDGITSIGSGAFRDCKKMSAIILPQSITFIGKSAFNGCISLKALTIPSTVNRIENNTFYGCSSLTSITIPSEITYVGSSSFYGCSALSSVISQIKEPFSFGASAFGSISTNCSLTVPYGKKDAYIAKGWTTSVFNGGIVEMPDTRTAQTISLQFIPSMTYGAANYTLPANTQQNLALTWSSNNTNVAIISGNTLYVKGVGTTTITASQIGNDNYKPFSKTYTITVAKAPLTITAKSYTMIQGDALPTFEATYSGFKNNDTQAVLTTQPAFICEATAESPAGTYSITPSSATAANYAITYVPGTLTIIEKASQTISLTSLPAMTYGHDNYTLPIETEEGFILIRASGNTNVATVSGNILTIAGAGTAAITATQEGNDDYKPFSKEFTLTVAKAPLTIKANDASKNLGEANPAFTASYEGFVGDDDASVLTAQPNFTCEATAKSPVGTYDINVSGAETANYEISYVKGTLTIIDVVALNNRLGLTDLSTCNGSKVLLPIDMYNTESIKGLQFDLRLPAGVTIATDELGNWAIDLTDRSHSSHEVSADQLSNGDYRILVSSLSAQTFNGTEGTILNIQLNVENNMAEGEYEVKIFDITLNTVDNASIVPADASATLTINARIIEQGDANGDGKVNVTDVGMVIDHILEHTPIGFIESAADLNHDGHVNVTDVGLIIDIILSDPASAKKRGEGNKVDMLAPQ